MNNYGGLIILFLAIGLILGAATPKGRAVISVLVNPSGGGGKTITEKEYAEQAGNGGMKRPLPKDVWETMPKSG